MKKLPNIAFIGLGNMGFPMAVNLLKAGYVVYGVDSNKETEKRFTAAGGEVEGDIRTLCQKVDIVLSSLPNPEIVESVYLGVNGIVDNVNTSSLLIDFSTVSPKLNEQIGLVCREKGIGFLAAPVSGGVIGAELGTLTIMAGGTKEYFDAAYPLFKTLGSNIFHNGEDSSAGTKVKLLNNLMVGFYTQAVAEMVSLGNRIGIDIDMMFENLNNSYGQSRVLERNYKQFIALNNFKPGFTTDLLLKDLKLAKELAEEHGASLPIGDKLIEYYSMAIEKGLGGEDMSSVYLLLNESLVNSN